MRTLTFAAALAALTWLADGCSPALGHVPSDCFPTPRVTAPSPRAPLWRALEALPPAPWGGEPTRAAPSATNGLALLAAGDARASGWFAARAREAPRDPDRALLAAFAADLAGDRYAAARGYEQLLTPPRPPHRGWCEEAPLLSGPWDVSWQTHRTTALLYLRLLAAAHDHPAASPELRALCAARALELAPALPAQLQHAWLHRPSLEAAASLFARLAERGHLAAVVWTAPVDLDLRVVGRYGEPIDFRLPSGDTGVFAADDPHGPGLEVYLDLAAPPTTSAVTSPRALPAPARGEALQALVVVAGPGGSGRRSLQRLAPGAPAHAHLPTY